MLTESDKRKYKDIFSKLTSPTNETMLPQLCSSSIQAKTKVMKSFLSSQPTNVPTNLTLTVSMVQQDISTSTTTTTTTITNSSTKSSENNTTISTSIPNDSATNNNSWMYCSQLPSLPHQKTLTKTSMVRQVTNVVKHNYRQQIHTDKII